MMKATGTFRECKEPNSSVIVLTLYFREHQTSAENSYRVIIPENGSQGECHYTRAHRHSREVKGKVDGTRTLKRPHFFDGVERLALQHMLRPDRASN